MDYVDNTITIMMLRINRHVIRSLVQHIIGYDFAERRTGGPTKLPIPTTFGAMYRGVYAISIAIQGRHGGFLTKIELLALVTRMQAYIEAAEYRLNRQT